MSTLVDYDVDKIKKDHAGHSFLIDFYKVSFKRNFRGQIRYGQGFYDFEEGGLAFLAPNQMVTMTGEESSYEGYTLYFHADLIRNYLLSKRIAQYGLFAYATSEALFLSEKEKNIISGLLGNILVELDNNIDAGLFRKIVLPKLSQLLIRQELARVMFNLERELKLSC